MRGCGGDRAERSWKRGSEKILGFDIDHSFLTYKKEAEEFGYEVGKISMKGKPVIFNRGK